MSCLGLEGAEALTWLLSVSLLNEGGHEKVMNDSKYTLRLHAPLSARGCGIHSGSSGHIRKLSPSAVRTEASPIPPREVTRSFTNSFSCLARISTWRIRHRSICEAFGGSGNRGWAVKGEGASESLNGFVSVTIRRGNGMGVEIGKEERAGIV